MRSPLLNGPDVFAWNADKGYLIELAEVLPTIPSRRVDDTTLVAGLQRAVADFGAALLKPATGAGGVGVCVVEWWNDDRLEGMVAGPWIVQPLVESVRTRGETSIYVFDGRAVSQVDKHPGGGEVRVHEVHGGRSAAVALDPERADLATRAVRATEELLGRRLDYARVDLLWWEERWCVPELELIEPGLYLGVVPSNAEAFADLVVAALDRVSAVR